MKSSLSRDIKSKYQRINLPNVVTKSFDSKYFRDGKLFKTADVTKSTTIAAGNAVSTHQIQGKQNHLSLNSAIRQKNGMESIQLEIIDATGQY